MIEVAALFPEPDFKLFCFIVLLGGKSATYSESDIKNKKNQTFFAEW